MEKFKDKPRPETAHPYQRIRSGSLLESAGFKIISSREPQIVAAIRLALIEWDQPEIFLKYMGDLCLFLEERIGLDYGVLSFIFFRVEQIPLEDCVLRHRKEGQNNDSGQKNP